MSSYTITRTKPYPSDGLSIPCFIHNLQFHLASVDVYEDGSFDAWGLKDREFFEKCLRRGWVQMCPPDGAKISIHAVGGFVASNTDWAHSDDQTYSRVMGLLDELNPVVDGERRRELVDFQGSDVEIRGNVRYAKMGLADEHPYRITEDGERIAGRRLRVIERRAEVAELEWMTVYADGLYQLGLGPLLQRAEVMDAFREGDLTTHVGDGEPLRLHDLGIVHPREAYWTTSWEERMKEFKDLQHQLQGGKSIVQQTRESFDAYQADQTSENLEKLRECYLAVPEHLRMYCGDMDSKDWPIRRALGLIEEDSA